MAQDAAARRNTAQSRRPQHTEDHNAKNHGRKNNGTEHHSENNCAGYDGAEQ